MKVEEILQSKGSVVYAVSPNDKITDAVSLLNEKNIGAVVVKDSSGDAVGILSERDIVRKLGREGVGVLSTHVKTCMTRNIVTCRPDTLVDEVMNRMTDKRIRHMPVVSNGKVVGMISIGDVVKRKIEQTEQEAAALREYIAS